MVLFRICFGFFVLVFCGVFCFVVWFFEGGWGGCMFLPAEEVQSSPEAPDEPYSLMELNYLPEECGEYVSAEFPQGTTIQEYIVKYSQLKCD